MLIALKTFYRGLFKASLNSISIAIGVTAVLIINALSNFGINAANVMLNRMGINGYLVNADVISNENIVKIHNISSVDMLSPINRYICSDTNLPIIGGTTDIRDIYSIELDDGNFFSAEDVNLIRPVCVISSNVAKDIFNTSKCIGQKINFTIQTISQSFTVIGVYRSDKLISSSLSQKEPIYVPYTIIESLDASNTTDFVLLAEKQNNKTEPILIIQKQLNHILGEDLYSIDNVAADREKIDSLMSLIKGVLGVIVGVSLIVSIIGLMVIMIINIRSRAGEIGLKKALGASNKAIVYETVIEAVFTSSVGAIQGFLLFNIILFILNIFNVSLTVDFTIYFSVSFITVLSAVFVSLIPSYVAAKINPAMALKTD